MAPDSNSVLSFIKLPTGSSVLGHGERPAHIFHEPINELDRTNDMTETIDARSSKKVPDGKLIRVDLTYDDRIESVTITGDFFLEPPEAREELERAIEGHPNDVERDELLVAIQDVDASLIGFTAGDLADVTREALT
ncbi:hypothetical protein HLASF_1055 [Halanaeroarchaeum sulfurireducens]|uniref:Lipoate--protein ligase n=2 Tax=Halanaeroarchaeum sulfurireducens TaxID=1604004 RepID=A0A0F7PD24_9EURY|nr:hypothetical protein HLASF_1055 [Halanaeroarchaeum sulfurireducens]ALG81940.1 hypothetical protein HLASA_1044 [Halanaeroarchaeum sulfurireducens]